MSLSSLKSPTPSSTKFHILVAIMGLIIVLLATNMGIKKYETHLSSAQQVMLALSPVDPRSMLQGDYMALNYAISEDVLKALEAEAITSGDNERAENIYILSQDGEMIIKKDAQGVGHFVRLIDPSKRHQLNLADDEMLLAYRLRQGQLKLATNAFFFQEGQAAAFEQARYGLFRVNDKGQPLLTDMVDDKFQVIDPKSTPPVHADK